MEETSSRSMHAVPFAYLALKLEFAIFIKRHGMKLMDHMSTIIFQIFYFKVWWIKHFILCY
ncbi:hypothetical protein S83_000321, partial [Arachis hypogaea]